MPFLVLEAAAASLAPLLFSLEASLDCCFCGWGFGFFFGFLSLTSGLLPAWKLGSRASKRRFDGVVSTRAVTQRVRELLELALLLLEEEKVRGNETLEDLRELYLMFEPPGNHP